MDTKDTHEQTKKPSERDLVFYYSREHRLESASPAVRRLNEEGAKTSFNPLRSLTATKPLLILFVTIIIIVGASIMLGARSKDEAKAVLLGGNSVTASALRYQGATYVVLQKTAKDGESVYTGWVDLAASVPTAKNPLDFPIINERFSFNSSLEEEFRFALPYETPQVLILLKADEALVTLRIDAK
ncbi:hypothetical protein ACYULU_09930 [Breznakiellaceae bacterium SP9]